MTDRTIGNRFAYIPPQCYTATRTETGSAVNPCFVCHGRARAPNYVDDLELQTRLVLPATAADNPWPNQFAPAIERAAPIADDALLAYVRRSNYFGDAGAIALAEQLAALPAEWDGDGDSRWGGYVPDAYFKFDERGYDQRPDGSATGWRAYGYYPLPGAFLPTNGSIGDALIRLDPVLARDEAGQPDSVARELNFAIVEALITRRDVPIAPADEQRWGVDLDLDGALTTARRVKFDAQAQGQASRMHYVGQAHALERGGRFPIAPGLFPLNTEFLHTLRYLDLVDDRVSMAPRLKELRYAKKSRWFDFEDLQRHADAERIEQLDSSTGSLRVSWQFDRGVYNRQGWLLQGFIEAADGALRPQTYEETAFCVGCHGGVGVTTDSTFSFARKLPGYSHWTQRDLRGVPEPRRVDGSWEYTHYLQQNGAGDEFRENRELTQRFFDARGQLRPERVRALHADISTLLMPSAERALALDRAYLAVVREQSYVRGRDAVLAPSGHVQRRVEPNAKTGIIRPVSALAQLAP